MALATQTINLDLRPHYNKQNTNIVYCSQYDSDLRNVVVNIADAGTAVNVSTYTIYVEGTKPDKHGFSYELTSIGGTVANNVVTFPLQLQMTAVAGITNAELVFYSDDERIGSANFILAVEQAGLADDIDVSDTDIPAYVDGAQQAAAAAEDAKDDAIDAKDLAVSAAETAQAVLDSIPEDYSDLSDDVDDLKSALLVDKWEQLSNTWVKGTSSGNRYDMFIGQVNGKYKITLASGIWGALRGFVASDYSGSPAYDSGTVTDAAEFDISSDTTGYYYEFRIGHNTSTDITESDRANCKVFKYINETILDVYDRDFVKETLSFETNLSTRLFAVIGQKFGEYYVTCSDSGIWFALQGYSDPNFSGTRVYDSGSKYSSFIFSVPNDGNYYRVVFGKTSAFTTADINACNVYRYLSKDEYVADIDTNVNALNGLASNVMTIMHGGTTAYPSNTLGLYKKAYQSGIMYWECDVRPCADGYVLCHDNDIYNHAVTANGQTIAQGTVYISANTVATLQTYKFGVITNQQASGVVEGFENDTIPTLKEFLLLAKAVGAVPFIEIKFTPTEAQMKDICDIIKNCGMLNQSYILGYQSVDTVIPYAIQNGIKKVAMIINDGEASTSAVDTAYSYVSSDMDKLEDVIFEPTTANFTSAVSDYAASKGMRTGVWTVAESVLRSALVTLLENGCTAFTTNKPNVSEMIKDYYLS